MILWLNTLITMFMNVLLDLPWYERDGLMTLRSTRLFFYPKKDRNNFLSEAFKTETKDIYFEKKVIIDHFKNK